MRFRTRLIAFLILLLACMQIATAVFVYSFARHRMVENGKRELTAANELFARHLDVIAERVSDGAHVLALDFALRRAIAQKDQATTQSVLRNHGNRIGAYRMMSVGLDGTVTTDTRAYSEPDRLFPFPDLLDTAGDDGHSAALVTLGNTACWMVVAPVTAPDLIGYIAACVPVGDALVEELRQISPFPGTIAIVGKAADSGWMTFARSADQDADRTQPETYDLRQGGVEEIALGGHRYLSSMQMLPTAEGSAPLYVVVNYPLNDVLRQNWSLFGPMLAVSLAALVLGVLGAVVIAGSVSKPIEALAAAAQSVEQGDYAVVEHLPHRSGELGELASSVSAMVRAIEEREARLIDNANELKTARDEALKADSAKSHLLSNMSHELRTPLNSVIGFSQMLKDQTFGPLGDKRYTEFVLHINEAGKKLLELVEMVLEVANLDLDVARRGGDVFEIRGVLESCIEHLDEMARQAAVVIKHDVSGQVLPCVEGDGAKIKKAILHILHNAIKFSHPNDQVVLSTRQNKDNLIITVSDTGQGIPQEELPRVVQPFHKVHVGYDSKYDGAGLGLSVAMRVIRMHGGSLHLQSELGKGTTVTIALPIAVLPQSTLLKRAV